MWEVTLGWAAAAYAKSDPAYAAELWLAWERACAPMGLEPSPPDQVIRPIGAEGLDRRGRAGCFLALGSGLGLVGTASSRR